MKNVPYYSEMPDFELKRAHEDDAGYDLPIWDERLVNGEWSHTGEYVLQQFESKKFKTGVHIGMPVGKIADFIDIRHRVYGQLDTRSGTSDHKLILLCHTIDAPYRGNIRLVLMNLNPEPVTIKNGVSLAQIIFNPFGVDEQMKFIKCPTLNEFMEKAGNTLRGVNGFNSTGGGLGK